MEAGFQWIFRQGCQISIVKNNAESFVIQFGGENDQDLESRLGTTLVTEATMLQRWFPLSIKKTLFLFVLVLIRSSSHFLLQTENRHPGFVSGCLRFFVSLLHPRFCLCFTVGFSGKESTTTAAPASFLLAPSASSFASLSQILFTGKLFDPALWRESCPIGDCPWACGLRFHMCKVFFETIAPATTSAHRQMTTLCSVQITGHLMLLTGSVVLEDLVRLFKRRRRTRTKSRGCTE